MKKSSNKRNWLNPISHDDTGSIASCYSLDVPKDRSANFIADLTIRDCGRQINLCFGVWSHDAVNLKQFRKQMAQRRRKLNTIRKHLDHIESGLDKMEGLLDE